MACCEKRPYLCGVLVLGILALFFHLVGFVTPGWIILRRSLIEEEVFEFGGRPQLIDNGGMVPPHEDDTTTDVMFRRRRSESDSMHDSKEENRDSHHSHSHNSHHHGDGNPNPGHRPNAHNGGQRQSEMSASDGGMMHEQTMVQAWVMEITAEINVYDVRMCYGLWYSKLCVHGETMGDDDLAESRNGRESSSSDRDGHHMGNSRCKKISTKLALSYSSQFDGVTSKPGNQRNLPLSDKNFGYASLKENQVESCVVLAFLVLGLISAVVGFRKANEGRCAAIACVIFMLLAAFVAIVPVARLSHYSMTKAHQRSSVMVHPPYSVIATGVGALFALITAIVAGYALRMKSAKQSPGAWLQFNNELDQSSEKKEKSSLGYCAEPIPVNAGLYDICNFEVIKPVEEMKKPEEESDEIVI